MPNITLPEAMRAYAERQVEAGLYDDLSDVMRAGLRRLMEEDGAVAFEALRRDVAGGFEEPAEEVDLRTLLLADRGTGGG